MVANPYNNKLIYQDDSVYYDGVVIRSKQCSVAYSTSQQVCGIRKLPRTSFFSITLLTSLTSANIIRIN